jgi:hypothetical protein
MAKYLKSRSEILKGIDEIADRLTVFDLVSYMGIPLVDEDQMQEIDDFKFKGDSFNDNSVNAVINDEMGTLPSEDLEETMLEAA